VARLVIYSSGVVNQTVELTGQNIRIGRASSNDVVLFDPAQAVSRFHAELRCEDSRYILLDLNSANGTWVSDHRIQRIVLGTGTVAEIADYRLVLEADPDETTAPPSFRADVESGHASAPRAFSGTLVVSALPTPQEPTSPAPLPPEPAPPAPAAPPPVPMPSAAPVPVPPVPALQPARPSLPVPTAAAADSPPVAGRVGARGGARGDGGSSLSVRLARQPRALVVSVFALVTLVVGVIGIIVGGEFLLSSPDGSNRHAQEQGRARQNAAPATPAVPPAIAPPPTAEVPAAMPPSAPPPLTPAPPVVPTPRPADRSRDRVNPEPPAPATVRPDSPPVSAGLTRRAGESQADFLMRAQRLQGTYSEAMAALQAKDFPGALTLFERLEKEQPGLLDVPARLGESREGLRESKRVAAQASLTAAASAEQRGDFVEAQREYQRALDADPVSGADEALRRVRAQMKSLGDAAFKRAKTYDAMSRTEDAIAQYERAAQLLPPDDPNRKAAKERLDILRASFIK
jgi:hypothetical protein